MSKRNKKARAGAFVFLRSWRKLFCQFRRQWHKIIIQTKGDQFPKWDWLFFARRSPSSQMGACMSGNRLLIIQALTILHKHKWTSSWYSVFSFSDCVKREWIRMLGLLFGRSTIFVLTIFASCVLCDVGHIRANMSFNYLQNTQHHATVCLWTTLNEY